MGPFEHELECDVNAVAEHEVTLWWHRYQRVRIPTGAIARAAA